MALSCIRLGSQAQRQFSLGSSCVLRNIYAPHVRVFSSKTVPVEGHDEKNLRLQRPQSPHLTIYKPQLTSMLSISHRATGLAMGSVMISWGIGALVLPKQFPEYLAVLESWHLAPASVLVLKFALAFPFSYHYCNGVRHLLWDMGRFLTLKEVYTTGYVMLFCAFSLASLLTYFL
uniref:(California timema) hypothetical protein n=1 Tax=Timema californicum TaxID=61474 RepID=A0A7R9PBT9_TIMCA|nr:unnamed protein product [Timema californicum]